MSQENIAVAREAIEAWNAGEMERLRDCYDPDAVMTFDSSANWPEPGPFIGRDAIMREFSRVRDAFDVDSLNLVGDLLAAEDRVVAHATWRGTGRGPQGELEMAWVLTLRNRLIVRADIFLNRDDALEAAGLSE